ncbi:MAG: hypothetical protein KGI50_07690 [Patescibacteria group bacterium]|nr:hypothetical protein [Patescibacteria group bacterium]
MITEQTINQAESRLQQLLNLIRDRKFGNTAWETIVMLKINLVDQALEQLLNEIERD